MSPANARRFVVKGHDYEDWSIIVEADTYDDAIGKAKRIYFADGFGNTDTFTLLNQDVTWTATALVAEVRR